MNRQPVVQTVALVVGVIYLALGVLGFLPVARINGALLGLFRVTVFQNLIHVVIGIAGLAAAASESNSKAFGQIAGLLLLVLGLLGFFVLRQLGLLDVGGAVLALASGAILAYFGFLAPTFRR